MQEIIEIIIIHCLLQFLLSLVTTPNFKYFEILPLQGRGIIMLYKAFVEELSESKLAKRQEQARFWVKASLLSLISKLAFYN